MANDELPLSKRIALFRLSVLGDLVHLAPGSAGIGDALRQRAAKDYEIPGTLRTRLRTACGKGSVKSSS